ncbi:NADH dehydrogenase [ubiquinone] iron-sulfur protein 6, mitochondrial [Tribolium castaneum]|uniref:NADH dehydrogenase [ubiquinone] iron-sulfur protein 6, mitochondrial n=1 Tax=Tribolium castaneum TaxID=7070 RepID=D6WLU6_TRICA|nr:PREDICTED: NADH dehydrogenase [ubiquinone] iron-sulfur protein 6, mitochondrial [Tribolium castaneum]EFA04681.1 putative NADH dehydrogenase [ubiquinone] iron-sulfur protein 6, mitochondrial-like Protein [Tribolium castaneum]|eukprot:XP_974018.1 PREDICTED: NADH dehydrogenase [ubiquinone] iron-sulfur protein 6, mitochondrial [Tribolium castaneum]
MSNILAKNISTLIKLQPKYFITNAAAGVRKGSDWVPQEKVTHTGQKWEPDDYRLSRFVGRPKHVNPNFAIDLIAEVPPKACKERVVWCDGGGGPTGHPKVYINLDKPGNHSCGYCGLRYYLDHGH